jgi:ParB family transcriptional regulator, chromosome partitioning protein
MARKPLGRGLNALLSAEFSSTSEEVRDVDIEQIEPSPQQPRTQFNQNRLQELAQSIQSNGIIQPLLLRRRSGAFQLVAGERRWRAAQLAGLRSVPAIIREIPDDKLFELALIENIQRQELSPVEEANAYKKLIESLGLTQDEIAQRVGRDRSFITNYLRVLKLPADILSLVEEEKLSMGHARALLAIPSPQILHQMAQRIIRKHWSVRETEHRIRALAARQAKAAPPTAPKLDPNIRAAESKLRTHLSRQVKIMPDKAKSSGKIEIQYYDAQDLDRLYRFLLGAWSAM